MIHFFRRIRQKLLTENRFTKYMLYAIGEIALVMIGILLALQVNNWNEHRKDGLKESQYLHNIKSDLEVDLSETKDLRADLVLRISRFKTIDTTFNVWGYLGDEISAEMSLENIRPHHIFNRGRGFKPILGAYAAIKDNGDIELIANKDIYSGILKYYEDLIPSQHSLYEDLKKIEHELNLKYSKEITYGTTLDEVFVNHNNKDQILADCYILYRKIMHLGLNLTRIMESIEELTNEIHLELEDRN